MDIEHAIVGSLSDPSSLAVLVRAGVRSEHFEDEEARRLWDFSVAYWTQSRLQAAPSRALIEEEAGPWLAQRGGWPDDVGLPADLAARVIRRHRRNRVQDVLREVADRLDGDPEEALTLGLSGLTDVVLGTTSRERVEPWAAGYGARYERYLDMATAGPIPPGIPIGWEPVTRETHGLHAGELSVLVGFTGIGKSWGMCKIAKEAAEAGHRVYFASLENSKDMTMRRLDCIASGVSYRDYERGTLDKAGLDALEEGRGRVEEIGDRLVVDTPRARSERTAAELYARAVHEGAGLIVGDQLSWLFPSVQRRDDRLQDVMGRVVVDILELTRQYSLASVWAAQFNRESMRVRRGRGGLQHIALSALIEQNVDWALALSANRQMRDQGEVLLDIIKARRSRPRAWVMDWRLEQETRMEVLRLYEAEEEIGDGGVG